MKTYIGIDLGTSAVKLILADRSGKILKTVTKEYPIYFPEPGWSEQDPKDWRNACICGLKELLSGEDRASVEGIGTAGQMHSLVILDENDEPIRNAILWNDGRTSEETEWLNTAVGKDVLSGYTANIAFAGFTAPKLMWLKKHEPENFRRIRRIMLPKDYINYILTGVHSCDLSDAGGTLLFDVRNRRWSDEMLRICDVSKEWLPELYESTGVTGTLSQDIAEELGLSTDVKVVAGAGDNAAAAVGTGTVGDGACNISIGTSGTVFITTDKFRENPSNALHSFVHADGSYHLMGCMLSAASCNEWLCKKILGTDDYAAEHSGITDDMLGRNEVFFLPYLMGERSPINDTDARGTFIGLSMDTSRQDMVQAVMEGVAFAIRDSLEAARSLGISVGRSRLCGGGAKSPLWRRMFANVLNMPLELPLSEEGPGHGAAMLAMTGCGEYNTLKECADAVTGVRETVYPDPVISARYEERYQKFRGIYPALKELFSILR